MARWNAITWRRLVGAGLLVGLGATAIMLAAPDPAEAQRSGPQRQAASRSIERLIPEDRKLLDGSTLRGARSIAIVDDSGRIRVFNDSDAAPVEQRVAGDDAKIRALLDFMDLPGATSFAVIAYQNPKCTKQCDLIGGEFICNKVCN